MAYIPKALRTPELEELNQKGKLTVCACLCPRAANEDKKSCKRKTYLGESATGKTYCIAMKNQDAEPSATGMSLESVLAALSDEEKGA